MKATKIFVLFFAVILFSASCKKNEQHQQPVEVIHHNENETPASEIKNIEVKTFAVDNGWGYDIYINDQKYIHQDHIPAVNGLHVFATAADAQKVADLAVQKLRSGMMQPTISQEELAQLGIVIQ